MKEKKEKPQYNMLQNLWFLMKEGWKLEKGIVLVPVALEAVRLLQQLAELFIAPVILSKIEQRAELPELLMTIGVFSIVIVVLGGLFGYIGELSLRHEGRLRLYFEDVINWKLCTTSYSNMLTKDYRECATEARRETAWPVMSSKMYLDFVSFMRTLAGFSIYLLLLSNVSVILMLLVVVTAGLGYVLNLLVNRWSFEHREETKDAEHKMSYVYGTAMENEMGKDIRIFGLADWLKDIYDAGFAVYWAFIKKREKKYLLAGLCDVFLATVRNGVAYVYLIHLALSDNLSASEFLLMFTAIGGFSQWVTGILENLVNMHKKSLGICKLRKFLDYPEPFQFETGDAIMAPEDRTYTLELEDVTYQYPEAEKPTISHMNLSIKPGEKLAIVGLNGAGKTTLVKLLCGFLDPTEGRVLLNGEDIRKFNRREYYKLFAAVFQEFSILCTTIAANVAQNEEDIDYDKVRDCLDKAGLLETVEALPKGLETQLGKQIYDEGIELSGGQTQRLILARALYKEAPMLFLDEPTAALDPIAENDIYMKYNDMSKDKSSVFISHRLASTRFCDRILFLENGLITEEGTHEELLAKDEGYAKLFEVQARYYQEDAPVLEGEV